MKNAKMTTFELSNQRPFVEGDFEQGVNSTVVQREARLLRKGDLRLTFDYLIFNSIPTIDVLKGIETLHEVIFGNSDNLINKMASKPQLVVITAMDRKKVIGYKIGYDVHAYAFYSWLGGVDPNYRGFGIATVLMEKQHQYLKQKGYQVVQTKTMNRWRYMLVLNIKNGFDIVDTYTDERGLHKITLEKKLFK